jgi:HK97 family phage major capsid protein
MSELQKIREEREAVQNQLKALHDRATSEDRGFTDEEKAEWESGVTREGVLGDREERQKLLETGRSVTGENEAAAQAEDIQAFNEQKRSYRGDMTAKPTAVDRSRTLRAWLARGRTDQGDPLPQEYQESAKRCGVDLGQANLKLRFDRGVDEAGIPFQAPRSIKEANRQAAVRAEQRAQSVGTDSAGGYTVPDEMMRAIDIALLQYGGMRQVSTVLTTSTGADLPIPTVDDTSQTGELLSENSQIAAQDVTFAQVVLETFMYTSKNVLVSWQLMQDNAVNLPSLLGELLGTRIGRIQNTHFTTGDASSKPNGVVTAASDSSVTTASNTAVTYAEMISIKHSVDPAYRPSARWMFHDTILQYLKTMLDSQNRPIWLPGSTADDAPPTFDGDPYTVNQDVATGASAKAILYGDFSKYYIRDAGMLEMVRLDERYADYLQSGFFGFLRSDGDLINTAAVKYATLAA